MIKSMETQDKKKAILSNKKGVVVSDKMDKTIVVVEDTLKTHPKYKKRYKSSKKYKVHDPENSKKVGDTVEFISVKPVSKGKNFVLADK